jgi:hypothetical protein
MNILHSVLLALQKESDKVTTIEEKKLSKVILIVDDDPDISEKVLISDG